MPFRGLAKVAVVEAAASRSAVGPIPSHPTVGVALYGPNVYDRLGSSSDDDGDDVLTLALISLKSRPWSQRQGSTRNSRWKKTSKYKTTVYMHRSRTITQPNGMPSRITCNQTIPGACHPWYFNYTRKKRRTDEGKTKENKKRKERKTKRKENRNQNKHALKGAGRVLRGQGCCLLVRSVLRYVQLMDKQKDQT